MPHTPEEKKRAITRLRRITGQAEALVRAVESQTPCSELLQQIAALRGAVNGLMADILESHLQETVAMAALGATPKPKKAPRPQSRTASAPAETAEASEALAFAPPASQPPELPEPVQKEIQHIVRIIHTYLK